MFAAYRRALVTRPYLTSAVTSALVLASGDSLAQAIERRRYLTEHPTATPLTNPALAWQPNRTLILSAWGGLLFSPFFTRFFHFLDAQPFLRTPSPRNIAFRVAAIFVASQPLNAFFFVYTSAMEYALPVDRLGVAHVDSAVVGPAPALIEAAADDVNASAVGSALPIRSSPSLPALREPHPVELYPPQTLLPSVGGPLAPSPLILSPGESGTARDRSFQAAYLAISERATAQVMEKMPIVVRYALIVWGPFNIFNQWLVPLQWRVVTGSFVSVAWNCGLSLLAHEEVGAPIIAEESAAATP